MKNPLEIHLIGNAHLDVVWLWRWQEGYAEIKATFRSALDRMNEFPDFIFTCSSAAYYAWIEENEPEMFAEIKQRVQEKRWNIVGGWWIQPDCNIPCGESFARQSLYGQRYFSSRFGCIAATGYNVDTFGHCSTLPQILSLSGMNHYVFLRPHVNENARIPSPVFFWQSDDGSKVLTYRINNEYGSKPHEHIPVEERKIAECAACCQEKQLPCMDFYGIGNHGGGPSIANLKHIKSLQADNRFGCELLLSSPDAYFQSAAQFAQDIPVYQGELQHHAKGCYSTASRIKMLNRQAEQALLHAEKFLALAHALLGFDAHTAELGAAWENVMFNQFHDIMGGCCVQEAIEDAVQWFGSSLTAAAKLQNAALQKLSWQVNTMGEDTFAISKEKDWSLWECTAKGTPVIVFNPLSWPVEVPVQVNSTLQAVYDHDNNRLPMQIVRGPQTNLEDKWNTLFQAQVPALGYRLYWVRLSASEPCAIENTFKTSAHSIENKFTRITVEEATGAIALYDKVEQRFSIVANGALGLVMDLDKHDTWAHQAFAFDEEIGRFSKATIKVIETGPLRATIRVTTVYHRSTLRQDFILYHNKSAVTVRVKLNWQEEQKMLKLSFPVNVQQAQVCFAMPYGFLQRETNGAEEPMQQWLDLYEQAHNGCYGLAIMNSGKYSVSVLASEVRMTVVNSSAYADHFAVQNRDEFCEYMDIGVQEFTYGLLHHSGSWQENEVTQKAAELNTQFPHIVETYHQGCLPAQLSGIAVSAQNVEATVLKRAEEQSGYILRCFETAGADTSVTIELPLLKRSWSGKLRHSEIKTLLIPDDGNQPIHECNLLEE